MDHAELADRVERIEELFDKLVELLERRGLTAEAEALRRPALGLVTDDGDE
jgi:hypothetical protein